MQLTSTQDNTVFNPPNITFLANFIFSKLSYCHQYTQLKFRYKGSIHRSKMNEQQLRS